jgi:diguanylate cyclase (GGDEF)-like protein
MIDHIFRPAASTTTVASLSKVMIFSTTFAFLLFAHFVAHAEKILSLDAKSNVIRLEPFIDVYKDTTGGATIAEILSHDGAASFSPAANHGYELHFGYTDSAIWLRFRIKNDTQVRLPWLLELANPLLEDATLYAIRETGEIETTHAGVLEPFSRRLVNNRNFIFPQTFDPGETKQFFVRVFTHGAAFMPFNVYSPEAFQAREQNAMFFWGIYNGLILAIILFNLWLYFSTKDRVFLYYILWITAYMLVKATLNGLSYQFIWPNFPWWQNKAISFLMGLAVLGMGLFTEKFMDGFIRSPVWGRILKFCTVIGGIFAPASLLLPKQFGLKFSATLSQVVVASILVVSYQCYRRGFRPAGLFGIAWASLLVGLSIGISSTWGWLPSNLFTRYCYQVGSTIAVLLLSLALTDRIRVITEEHRLLQENTRRLQELSFTDALTCLFNKRHLEEHLPRAVSSAQSNGTSLSLLVLDVDDFKHYNDTYGHAAGDQVLRELAGIIRTCLRKGDVPCRFGGEEFVAVLPGSNLEGAAEVGERIRTRFASQSFKVDEKRTSSATVSVGAAQLLFSDKNWQSLFTRADEALYRAKADGKNRLEPS